MNKTATDDIDDGKCALTSQEPTYGYSTFYPTTPSPSATSNQPLPGQPPLPPMPPPPGALPPLPHVYSTMSQVAQMPTWGHAAPAWQWMTTSQASALVAQSTRDLSNNVARGNYARRDRYTHNRNNVYPPRNSNFHRKNRKSRFDQPQAQFDATSYFGQPLASGISLDWQRTGFPGQSDGLVSHMQLQSHLSGGTERHDVGDQDVKIVSEVAIKRGKQRKPMSQNYPSRPWNREDAQKALKVENEYSTKVRAQSLIIKFPDPDLNKDIVREFHQGIQSIHFQSPSGPRYCFVQMDDTVNIDEAISDLEKIPFGMGHLKVERKSLRDKDYLTPEEIDPYTLYVGNLPESVNVNEVKSKFPTATRVDVGYAQKMRNTRYAFIRYISVDESIAAYKKAHDLMWDTRSIIVRFRRPRGNACLPGEPKSNVKKVKDELNETAVKNEGPPCNGNQASCQEQNNEKINDKRDQNIKTIHRLENNLISRDPRLAERPLAPAVATETTQPTPISLAPAVASQPYMPPVPAVYSEDMITTIKAEPEDYEEIEMSYMPIDDDDDDDDDDIDEADQLDESNDEVDENDNEPDDDVEEPDSFAHPAARSKQVDEKNTEPPDHLDEMFNELENTAGDIEL